MTNLTMRAVERLHRRAVARRAVAADDRGLETAEVLLWLAATAGIILALTGQLENILDGVINRIQGLLG